MNSENVGNEKDLFGNTIPTDEKQTWENVANFGRHESSEQNKALSESMVCTDLISKGFDPHMPYSRDSIHDMVIEVSQNKWVKIQIKGDLKKTKQKASANLSTRGGKTKISHEGRKNTFYKDVGVHILAVCCLDGIFYYDISKHDKTKPIRVNQNKHIDLVEWIKNEST